MRNGRIRGGSISSVTLSPPTEMPHRAVGSRMAYILAASHSGSTLLAMLLGAHPQACTAGELKGARGSSDTYRCSCGEPIRDCGFWKRISAAMCQRGYAFEVT